MTGPDSVRTARTPAPRQEYAPALTSPDTVRTPGPDTVRVEYRATVPRRLLGAAIADAFGTIARARAADAPRPPVPSMRIPTLFARHPTTPYVTPAVTPGCEWVLRGEGAATRMWNGICVRLDHRAVWWVRRSVRPGGEAPPGFQYAETDPVTGIVYGWEPADRSHWREVLTEALAVSPNNLPGTYELVGPLVKRNPDGFPEPVLFAHGWAPFSVRNDLVGAPRTYTGLGLWLRDRPYEGIVWHHQDGRMAKLKTADFPTPRTP